MYHSVRKEDHVHASSSDALVEHAEEHVESVLEAFKGLYGLVHFGHVKVMLLRLLACKKQTEIILCHTKVAKIDDLQAQNAVCRILSLSIFFNWNPEKLHFI